MSGQDKGFEEAPERTLISACKVYMLEHALYKAAAVLCGPIAEKREQNWHLISSHCAYVSINAIKQVLLGGLFYGWSNKAREIKKFVQQSGWMGGTRG